MSLRVAERPGSHPRVCARPVATRGCTWSTCSRRTRAPISTFCWAETTMTADEVRDFIRTHHRGVLATTRRDGGTQLTPILVTVDDDGSLIISTSETTVKT